MGWERGGLLSQSWIKIDSSNLYILTRSKLRPEECINKMQILFYRYTNYSYQQLFVCMRYDIGGIYKIGSKKLISMISLSF